MNSFNHYAYGAIGNGHANLIGLKINENYPGFKRYTIKPLFDNNFDNIEGSLIIMVKLPFRGQEKRESNIIPEYTCEYQSRCYS